MTSRKKGDATFSVRPEGMMMYIYLLLIPSRAARISVPSDTMPDVVPTCENFHPAASPSGEVMGSDIERGADSHPFSNCSARR